MMLLITVRIERSGTESGYASIGDVLGVTIEGLDNDSVMTEWISTVDGLLNISVLSGL